MNFIVKFSAALAVVGGLAGNAMARPYASMIRLGSADAVTAPIVKAGEGTDIFYVLNEPAESVAIQLQDVDTNNIMATFSGTKDRGLNSVSWDGTYSNNGVSSVVPPGNYRLLIMAIKYNDSWVEVASQRSLAAAAPGGVVYETVYNGFSPNDMLFVEDATSMHFGRSFASSSYGAGSRPAVAATEFRADLSVADGTDGYDSRVFRVSPYDGVGNQGSNYNAYLWAGSLDPDNSSVMFYAGQGQPGFWFADLNNPAVLSNADPLGVLSGLAPRSVQIVREGPDRYAYFANDQQVHKGLMNGNELAGPLNVVANLSSNNRYVRTARVDSDGNLYVVSRGVGSGGAGGVLFRWDYADTVGANPSLTEANATWVVHAGSGMNFMSGPALSPDGDVYVAFATGSTTINPENGVYLVGHSSFDSVGYTLTTGQRVIDTAAMNWGISNLYHQVRTDPVGNVVIIDRQKEQLRMFTPGGESRAQYAAPDNMMLTITSASSVESWGLY